MSSIRTFFKDTVFYGIASVLPKIVSFALVGVYTAVFAAPEFSSQTKWYVYASFLNILLTMGMETSFFRFYSMQQTSNTQKIVDKGQVIAVSFALLAALSGVFLLASIIWQDMFLEFFGFQDSISLNLLVWITLLDTLAVIPFALLRAEGKTGRFLSVKVLNIVVMASTTLWLLLILPTGIGKWQWLCLFPDCLANYKPQVYHIFLANLIASALTLLFVVPEIKKIPLPNDRNLLKSMMMYSWPVMVAGLAYMVNENLDKLLIAEWQGEEANGIYAACYKLGVFMTLYMTAFRMGAEPFIFQHAHLEGAQQKYSLMMSWFVILGSVFMVAVMVNLDFISSFFLRQSVYRSGLEIVPVLLMANLFSGIYANLSVWYKLSDKTRVGMYISILGGGLTFLTLWLMVPVWGIAGGAYSTLTTYLLMAIISWYLGQKFYPVPYKIGRLSIVLLLAFGSSLLCFYILRDNALLRWVLFCVFCVATAVVSRPELEALKNDQ